MPVAVPEPSSAGDSGESQQSTQPTQEQPHQPYILPDRVWGSLIPFNHQNPYLYRMDLVKPQRKYTIGRAAKHSQPGMLPSDFPLDRSLMEISKSSVSCLDCVPLG